MQISKAFLVLFAILPPTLLAKDYGCSDPHEGEMHCVGKHHRNLKQCFKGKWRVYTCPKGCWPTPNPHCLENPVSDWALDSGMINWNSTSINWNATTQNNSTVQNITITGTSMPVGATTLKRYAYQGHI